MKKQKTLKQLAKEAGWTVKERAKPLPSLLVSGDVRKSLLEGIDSYVYLEGKPTYQAPPEEEEQLTEEQIEELALDPEDLQGTIYEAYGTSLDRKEIRVKPISRDKNMRGWGLPRFQPAPQAGISATNKNVGKAPTTLLIKKRNIDSARRQAQIDPEYIHKQPKVELGGTRDHRRSQWKSIIPKPRKQQKQQQSAPDMTKAIEAFVKLLEDKGE